MNKSCGAGVKQKNRDNILIRIPKTQQITKGKGVFSFYISVSCGVLFLLIGLLVFVAWSTKHVINGGSRLPLYFSDVILSAADFPVKAKGVFDIFRESTNPTGRDNPYKSILDSITNHIPIKGGVLVSKVKMDGKNQVVLISLSNKIERTVFDPNKIIAGTGYSDKVSDFEIHRESSLSSGGRVWHPHISSDLRLTYNIPGNDLISVDLKQRREVWRVYGAFHHSIEQDSEGNYWACASVDPKVKTGVNFGEGGHGVPYQDNCIIKISNSGKILQKISLTQLLIKSDLDYLLFGVSNPNRNHDPLHLNQVSPILENYGVLRKGQLLVSLRNLSTLLLIDPNEETVLWSKTGPWMNQHCALPLQESTISILDNHSFASGEYWLVPKWRTRVVSHNIESGETKNVLDQIIPDVFLKIGIEGRAFSFQKDGWIIEDSVNGTILLFFGNQIVYKWQNVYDGGKVGVISWCRYVDENIFREIEASGVDQKEW
jgi:hypothetical protein